MDAYKTTSLGSSLISSFSHLPSRWLGVDLSKLLLLESPKTWIEWHLMSWTIRFDFLVCCLYGNLAPSFLSFRISLATVALAIYQTIVKPCVVYLFLCSCWVFLMVLCLFFRCYVFGFATLVVGLRAFLCNHFGFLLFRLSGSFSSFWFSMKFFLFIK